MWAFFVQIATAVVLAGIAAWLAYRRQPRPEAGDEEDFGNPRAEEGTELPKIFGTVTVGDPQIAWFGDLLSEPIVVRGPRRYGFFGPRSRTVTGFKYYLGIHFVLSLGPVDSLNRIRIDKRNAYFGPSSTGRIRICKPNLFGASDREGGVQGELDVMLGLPDQIANDYLSFVTEGPHPAYRGVFSVVLRRGYIGNATNLRPWEFRIRRIDRVDPGYNGGVQWLPNLSQIYQGDAVPENEPQELMIAIDVSGSMQVLTSNGQTRLQNAKTAITGYLNSLRADLGPGRLATIKIIAWSNSVRNSISIANVSESQYDSLINFVQGLTIGGSTDFVPPYADAFTTFNFNTSGVNILNFNFISFVQSIGTSDPCKIRRFIFVTDGEPTDDITPAIASYEGLRALGVSTTGISIDLNVTGALDAVTDRAFRVNGGDPESFENILRSAFGEFDMNPVHILREVLISPDTGGTGLDSDAGSTWEAAAQTIFNEGFGISIAWRGTRDRSAFKTEIERHIDARSYIDRRTGKWEIKLIRNDYDANTLPVFDQSNVTSWSNINFPEPQTLLNQIVIVWNDPRKDESSSIVVSNPARIRMNNSQVIQEKVEYPGIHRFDLASRVAIRDLMTRSSALMTGEFVTSFLPTNLNLGSVIKLNNPRIGIFNRIVRITEIEDGDIRSNSTTVKFIEDRFSIGGDSGFEFEVPPVNNDNFPKATSPRLVEEASRYTIIERLGEDLQSEIFTEDPSSGFVFAAGGRPQSIAIDTSIWVDAGTGYEEIETIPFVPFAELISFVSARADHTKFVVQTRDVTSSSAIGKLAWLGGEQIIIDEIVSGDTSTESDYWHPETTATKPVFTITARRGFLDTSPKEHESGTDLLIYGSDGLLVDDQRLATQTVNVKMQTITSKGTLSLLSAPEDTVAFDSRANRPYPPGKVQIDGSYANPEEWNGTLTLTWVHRDRLLNPLIPHTDESQTASEAGTTFRVRAWELGFDGQEIGSPIIDVGAISALTYDIDTSLFTLSAQCFGVRVEVRSERDSLESNRNRIFDVPVIVDPLNIPTGAWYDANIFDSMFMDDIGTQPIEFDEDPVGLIENQKETIV